MAVDTLGHLLALHVTPASVNDRAEVGRLASAVQEATGETIFLIYVDQGYTGEKAAEAGAHKTSNCASQTRRSKEGLFPSVKKSWVVGRSFAWMTRRRMLVKDYERCAQTLAEFHIIAFAWPYAQLSC